MPVDFRGTYPYTFRVRKSQPARFKPDLRQLHLPVLTMVVSVRESSTSDECAEVHGVHHQAGWRGGNNNVLRGCAWRFCYADIAGALSVSTSSE